jgi:hypothetical protein
MIITGVHPKHASGAGWIQVWSSQHKSKGNISIYSGRGRSPGRYLGTGTTTARSLGSLLGCAGAIPRYLGVWKIDIVVVMAMKLATMRRLCNCFPQSRILGCVPAAIRNRLHVMVWPIVVFDLQRLKFLWLKVKFQGFSQGTAQPR